MVLKLILLFTLTPLLELALLIEVGRQIGVSATLVIVIATGVIGATLAKNQGLGTFRRIQDAIAIGQLPTDALLDGAFILGGGLLLLTPGMITDACGFFCLIPSTRRLLKGWIKRKIQLRLELHREHFPPHS